MMTLLLSLAVYTIVALALLLTAYSLSHRRPGHVTVAQLAVRGLYWLAELIQAYAVAGDSAIIGYRDYRHGERIRPRNEILRREQ